MSAAIAQHQPTLHMLRPAFRAAGAARPALAQPHNQIKSLALQFGCGKTQGQEPVAQASVFDPNIITYDPKAIYSPDGKLTWGQKVCDFLIRKVYQGGTRSTVYKWFGNPCPFKRVANKLSCSEYTLVMIHRFGVLKGIWLGSGRLMRCNPITNIQGNFNDPCIAL